MTTQLTNVQKAKAAIKAAGWKFYCDKTKAGWSVKVASQMLVPIADDEMQQELYQELTALAAKVVTKDAVSTEQFRRAGRVWKVRGLHWSRFHFNR